MADLSQTTANVKPIGSNARASYVQFGEIVVEGEAVYFSSDKYYKAESGDTAAKAIVKGIVLTPAAADGYGWIHTSGQIDVGATLTVGVEYYQSATAGNLCLRSDLVSTDYISRLGIASAAGVLEFAPESSGVQVP